MSETENAVAEVVSVEEVRNAVQIAEPKNVSQAITAMRAGEVTLITSIEATDFDSRLAVVDAVTTSSPLDENIGKRIELVHFVVQTIELVNPITGELDAVPRTILIDADGTAYHAISKGIFSGLENLVGIMGRPATWKRPIPVTVEKQSAKVGKVMVIRLSK